MGCNWGQSPFAHAIAGDNSQLFHVQKGTVPNCTLLQVGDEERKVDVTVGKTAAGVGVIC